MSVGPTMVGWGQAVRGAVFPSMGFVVFNKQEETSNGPKT